MSEANPPDNVPTPSPSPGAETRAFIAAIVVFFIGLLLIFLLNRLRIGDTTTLIALLLIPLLVYGIASNKIKEFSGGGISAKFQEVAPQTPQHASADAQSFQDIVKGGVNELITITRQLAPNRPVTLTLHLGQPGYQREAIRKYIRTLRLVDRHTIVLVREQSGRFAAMIEAATLLDLLEDPEIGNNFIGAISQNDLARLRTFPGLHWRVITKEQTHTDALRLMREENVETIIVIDTDNQPVGVVRLLDIVTRVLMQLTK